MPDQTPEKREPIGTFEMFDDEFKVYRKPSTLMVAEISRAMTRGFEGLGVVVDFLRMTMGVEEYERLREQEYESDVEIDVEELLGLVIGAATPAAPPTK